MQRLRTFRRWAPVTAWLPPPPPPAGLPPRSRIAAAVALPAVLSRGRFLRARLPLALVAPPATSIPPTSRTTLGVRPSGTALTVKA